MEFQYCPFCGGNFLELFGRAIIISKTECKYCAYCGGCFLCPRCDRFSCEDYECKECNRSNEQRNRPHS